MTESPRKIAVLHPDYFAPRKKREGPQSFHNLAYQLGRFIGITAGRFQNFMGKFVCAFRQSGKDAGSLFTHHSFIRTEDEMNGLLL